MNRPVYLGAFILAGLSACGGVAHLVPSDADVVLSRHVLNEPDPRAEGPYNVRSLYYGSGSDLRRPEYRDSVAIRTEPVDASPLVDLGSAAESRNKYWGFTPEAFPVNARVWYPDGPGPFPLVLVVHGNHNMKDFSDPGYDYLGQHLASHGYILASVDMNFINGGIREENDGRGWLLLKHLEAWRHFQDQEDNPLAGLADLDRIALIGHSRGGEAVGHAAAFNRLQRYPDDGNLTFDFGFGIRSIVAIAPVDGQYLPTGRHVPLEDVSYLVFHGSHDGDVSSFHGLRQYNRLSFSEGSDHFKAAVYMYRANHGQWNTVWNNKDSGPRSGRTLDLKALIEPEAQREMAIVYLTAFLEATLRENNRYVSIFRDHRVAGDWLPPTMYVTRYQHASFEPLATFEEDIDVTTGTAPGVRLEGDSLKTWREDLLGLRSSNRPNTSNSQQDQAVWLGWKRDSTGVIPAYHLELPAARSLGRAHTLELLASPESGLEEDSTASPGARLDLSVALTDSAGNMASLPLSSYGAIREPLDIKVMRRNFDQERFAETHELVLQSYSIPLADFAGVDLSGIKRVSLLFDRSEQGEMVVDDIGFARPPEAFLRYRLTPE